MVEDLLCTAIVRHVAWLASDQVSILIAFISMPKAFGLRGFSDCCNGPYHSSFGAMIVASSAKIFKEALQHPMSHTRIRPLRGGARFTTMV